MNQKIIYLNTNENKWNYMVIYLAKALAINKKKVLIINQNRSQQFKFNFNDEINAKIINNDLYKINLPILFANVKYFKLNIDENHINEYINFIEYIEKFFDLIIFISDINYSCLINSYMINYSKVLLDLFDIEKCSEKNIMNNPLFLINKNINYKIIFYYFSISELEKQKKYIFFKKNFSHIILRMLPNFNYDDSFLIIKKNFFNENYLSIFLDIIKILKLER